MESPTSNLMECPPLTLVAAAQQHGVQFHLWPPDTTCQDKAGKLDIWSHRDARIRPIVAAMRARREEIAAYLVSKQPRRIPFTTRAEEQFRREVLYEPDVLVGDLTWPVVQAMVISAAIATVDARLAEWEWERTRDRVDKVPPSTPPAPKSPPSSPPRVGYEYRGGKVVRR